MADELVIDSFVGITIFACRFEANGDVFLADGASSEVWGTDGRTAADYAVALTENGVGGHYVGDFDAGNNIAVGVYAVRFHRQSGGAPSDDDIPAIRVAEMDWRGTDGEIFRSTLQDFQEADIEINIAATPWELIMKKRGTETVLLTKLLRDTAGADVTAVTSVIGSQKDS